MTVDETGPAVTTGPPEPEPEFGEDIARLAAATLLAKGRTAEAVREHAADCPDARYMWHPIADAMDALLAEGFDAAAFAEELREQRARRVAMVEGLDPVADGAL